MRQGASSGQSGQVQSCAGDRLGKRLGVALVSLEKKDLSRQGGNTTQLHILPHAGDQWGQKSGTEDIYIHSL